MSDTKPEGLFRQTVHRWNSKFPFILIALILGMTVFTTASRFGVDLSPWTTHDYVLALANGWFMWPFFAFLGLEISIGKIIKSGRFVGVATLGGVLVPPLVCWIFVRDIYVAMGAMATDVAFSMAALTILKKGSELDINSDRFKNVVFGKLMVGLLILAVGDDLMGIGVLAAVFTQDVKTTWLVLAGVLLGFAYLVGDYGRIPYRVREKGSEHVTHMELVVSMDQPAFWWLLAIVNTFVLFMAGVHWVLGGCLVFICAPQSVKDHIEHQLKPWVPCALAVFGLVNGAMDVLAPGSWGMITFGACLGGVIGKQIGIFGGGLIGRFWDKREGGEYGLIPLRQIYALSMLASCNGTVAIYFVIMAADAKVISEAVANQGKLGFMLTVPIVLLQAFVAKFWIKHDPNFEDRSEEHPPVTEDDEAPQTQSLEEDEAPQTLIANGGFDGDAGACADLPAEEVQELCRKEDSRVGDSFGVCAGPVSEPEGGLICYAPTTTEVPPE